MKKYIITFILLLSFSFIFAQESVQTENAVVEPKVMEPKNEIQFDIGMYPCIETLACVIGGFFCPIFEGCIALPTINIQYLRYLNSYNALGTTFSFGVPMIYDLEYEKSLILYGAIMAKYRRIYKNSENAKLYGDIGLGFELYYLLVGKDFELIPIPMLAANIVPLGMWFGFNKFFGTIEFSVGTEGSFVTLGCGFRF